MRKIEKTVYKFDELSDKAKDKAIDNLRDINTDYEWYDYIFEDVKDVGSIIGINIDKIYFSGFWSQGDGACFKGSYSYKKGSHREIKNHAPKDKDLHKIASQLFDLQSENFYGIRSEIEHSGHYYHEMCTNIWVEHNDSYRTLSEGTVQFTKERLRDFMRWIYRSLEREYDYLTSEEAIIETIEANEYEFYEDGELL